MARRLPRVAGREIGSLLGIRDAAPAGPQGFVCPACGYQQWLQEARHCRRCGAPSTITTAPIAAPAEALALPAAVASEEPLAIGLLPRPLRTARPLRTPTPLPRHTKRPSRTRRGHRSRLRPLEDDLSASTTITRTQITVLRWVIGGILLLLVAFPIGTLTGLIAFTTLLYLGAFIFRLRIFWRALSEPAEIRVADDEARGLWEHSLPTYTVLVPAFHEPEVIGQVIANLQRLDYPPERLDIKLLLEEDDVATIEAAEAAEPPDHIQIVRVPAGEPRTKPRACNYGLTLARGKFVTIYDAEDDPEVLQLRRAVVAFRRLEDRIACLQAKLVYHNPGQNSITRWFSTEYAMWFSQLLPGLIADAAPLPLGGTSNHFRRTVLDEIGGWDPWNVTEDADLGIRLHRAGYRTAVLDSVTLEEANSDFVNWIKQRSRWYKGYMQTWLVHMRQPRQLWEDLGPAGMLGFHLFVGGTPLLALVNPLFWALTAIWFISPLEFIRELFPFWIYYIALFCLAFGNISFVYANMVAARQHGRPELVIAAMLSPFYWVMMSIAALKALIQLITAPSFWEKTTHGLDTGKSSPKARASRAGA
ncbi:MAG TPA: glycosyltransferase [Candidatus Limnocylindria bacterium]|jgi:cellulose synthase/poly-beta-1,6-N-acetylglucosamine synthase-like glycosyltransferase